MNAQNPASGHDIDMTAASTSDLEPGHLITIEDSNAAHHDCSNLRELLDVALETAGEISWREAPSRQQVYRLNALIWVARTEAERLYEVIGNFCIGKRADGTRAGLE